LILFINVIAFVEITVKVYQCFSAKFTARSELL
jgi:hypothetical protein